MLTDNAIIVIEGIKVGIEAGEDKLKVVREVVAQNQWPLFGATAIGIIAFAAIGLSEDSTGEVCQLAVLGHPDFPEPELGVVDHRHAAPELPVLQADRRWGIRQQRSVRGPVRSGSTVTSWFWRSASAGRWWSCAIVAFVAALYGFTKVKQSFFPPATRPQFMVDVFLPAGTHIRETEAFAGDVQRYIQALPGVTHVTSFIGGGGLRFMLVYSPEGENRAFVQFLVDVDDWTEDRRVDRRHPETSGRAAPERQRRRQEVSPGPGRGRAHSGAVPRPRSRETARTRRSGEASSRRRRRGGVRAQRLARA